MVDVLKAGLLEMGRNNWERLLGLYFLGSRSCLIFIIVVVTLAGKVIRSFVFMRWAELKEKILAGRSTYDVRSTNDLHIDSDREPRACHTRSTHRVSCCDRK